MQIIAESGSTKTNWCAIEEGKKPINFTTSGFNPMVQNREQISEIIKNEFYPYVKDHTVTNMYFYGAGCSTEENVKLMKSCFGNFLNMAQIEIDHDLTGAARGLWGHEAGIVAILGTGSNSCIYDGGEIIDGIPSLGYILGDEGSGAYMGKQLVRDYLYKQMPESLMEKLRMEYKLDKEKVFQRVYKSPNPNRWLASFSVFVRENFNEQYCIDLVHIGFQAFFKTHISQYGKYRDLPLGAIGSIAFLYKDLLGNVAEEYGFNLAKVIRSPLEELVKYHGALQKIAE